MPDSFFNEVTRLRPEVCNFIKKEVLVPVFSCEFLKMFKDIFFTEHLWTTASEPCDLVNENK